METRPHVHNRLLLGGSSGSSGKQGVGGGHSQVPGGHEEQKGCRVDGHQRTDPTPVHAMADLFKEVKGKDLQGLSGFMGWIGIGGYYHWKVAQLGLLYACPHLQGQPVPKGPMARPSR